MCDASTCAMVHSSSAGTHMQDHPCIWHDQIQVHRLTCCTPPMTGALDMPMASQGALLMSPLKYCPICKRAFVGSGAVCVTFCRFGCCPAAGGISNMQQVAFPTCRAAEKCMHAALYVARVKVYTWWQCIAA